MILWSYFIAVAMESPPWLQPLIRGNLAVRRRSHPRRISGRQSNQRNTGQCRNRNDCILVITIIMNTSVTCIYNSNDNSNNDDNNDNNNNDNNNNDNNNNT